MENENVIPAEAGIQRIKELDSRLHGNDRLMTFSGEPTCQQVGTKNNENPPISPFIKGGLKGIKEGFLEQILEKIEKYLLKDKEKSDVVHDFLSFLADEMIKINKEKQIKMKEFLDWLKLVQKIDIDILSTKFKKEFYNLLEQEFFSELTKKKIKLSPSQTSEIKKEFEKSAELLKEIQTKLHATDDLIDEIVYKLYGLNDEDIKMIKVQKL